jgi:hypothetical protein
MFAGTTPVIALTAAFRYYCSIECPNLSLPLAESGVIIAIVYVSGLVLLVLALPGAALGGLLGGAPRVLSPQRTRQPA